MSFADRDGVIWFDGQLVPWREAQTHVLTHTLHYGMGVFEGVRAYQTERGPQIFRLQEHTDRLFRSAHILGMQIPYAKDEVMEAHKLAIRENNLRPRLSAAHVFLRLRGDGAARQQPQGALYCRRLGVAAYMSPEAAEQGIKIRTSSYTRHHVNITMCKAKANGNYMNSMLALREADRQWLRRGTAAG